MIAALAVAQAFAAAARDNSERTNENKKEIAVPVIKQAGSLKFRCLDKPGVFSESYYLQTAVIGDPTCINPVDLLRVDFGTQTLIGYRVSGDCHIRARAEVFRNDAAQTYRVNVVRKSGECRAVGHFQGWAVVDKLLKDYKVEFSESKIEDYKNIKTELLEETLSQTEESSPVKTRPFEMNRCVNFFRGEIVIKSRVELLEKITNGDSRKRCLETLEKIDFKKEILLGVSFSSGYCRYPNGLKHEIRRDDRRKRYSLLITYDDPYGRTCRALGIYDLWLAVPKPPDDYEIKIEVASVLNKKYDY